MKIFFHRSDLDGHCSGAIVKQKYPDAELIGVDYADRVDRKSITPGETVFVLDFCFPKDDMIWLNEEAMLYWCDHHKSSIEMMRDYNHDYLCDNIEGLRAINLSGCELTWRVVHPAEASDMAIPWAVWALGRYDVWDHGAHTDILAFQYGMRENENTWPDSPIWSEYFSVKLDPRYPDEGLIWETVQNGKLILGYEEKQNAKYAKSMSYEAEFHGLNAIVMNKPFANSLVFNSVYDPAKHDIMILFGVKDLSSEFKYTLFCDKPDIDVSEIAIKHGGGGHKGAAGFYSKERVV